MNSFLYAQFLNNTVLSYLYAAGIFAAALAGLYILRQIVFARLRAMAATTETDLDDLAMDLIGKIGPLEYNLLAIYLAVRSLNHSPAFGRAAGLVLLLVFTYRAITIVQHLLNYWTGSIVAKRGLSEAATASVVNSTQVILRAVVWVTAALFVLDNLGVNVSAVLAGLGIGGVAVALAAQAILGDLFNFFVILLDKPFNVGDFVTSDSVSGTIEHIGLKSTRIRSITGELVVISNSNLLGSRIKNYQDLKKRRVSFKTGVVYGTGADKLRKVPALIKACVLGQKGTEFERSHLYNAGDFSLDFETVYYVTSGDYALFMDTQERVLLGIIEKFAAEGIEFAMPTQKLFVNKQEKSIGNEGNK